MEGSKETEDVQKKNELRKTERILHLQPEMKLKAMGYCVKQPVPWRELDLPKKTHLAIMLNDKMLNYEDTDTTISIGSSTFEVHMLVLQSYSEYFRKNVQESYTFTEEEVSENIFQTIYNWMIYTDPDSYKVIKLNNLLNVLRAAKFLRIDSLEEQCWTVINSQRICAEFEAYFLLVEAHSLGMNEVVSITTERIIDFFMILVTTSTYLNLNVGVVTELLNSSIIKVNCEQEVFLSAIRWLFHDWNRRSRYAVEVMGCVRFGYIVPNVLVKMNLSKLSPEVYEVMQIPQINKLRQEGLDHSILYFGNQHLPARDHHTLIKKMNLKAPMLRYYSNIHCVYETYNDFLFYLDALRTDAQRTNNPTEADKMSDITEIYEIEQ